MNDYRNLEIYNDFYKLMLKVSDKIVNQLPATANFKLPDELRKASLSIPHLIAKGYDQRFENNETQECFCEAMKECESMVRNLSETKESCTPFVDSELCSDLIKMYTSSTQRLYQLQTACQVIKKPDLKARIREKLFF